MTENVALQSFEKMQDYSQFVVSKLFSDEFFASFFEVKKDEPCHGLSDGKYSAFGKEKEDVYDKKEFNLTHRPLFTVRGDDEIRELMLLDSSVVGMTKKEEEVVKPTVRSSASVAPQ